MEKTGKRLHSLDALRGFDMFWIMGAPMIVASLYDIFGGNALSWCNIQMEHASWDGFRLMDLVFPLFLFIAGVSFPFSLGSRREKKESDSKIRRHLLKRALTLVLLGALYNGLLHNGFGNPRFASVLAHIGIAWFLATIIYMYTPKRSFLGIWIGCIVIGYGLLNMLVLSPDAVGTNPFLPENNIVAQFDRWFLPGKLYKGIFDPEGLLSLIPAVATALLGMVAGSYLKNQGKDSPSRKSLVLFTGGIILILLGELTSLVIPFNKALWSSSFMLLTGGISLSLLATFYWIVDVKKWDKWAFFFRVIGLNSITIYLAQAVIKFSDVSDFFLGSFIALVPKPVGELISGCGYVAVCWLFLWYLYKKNIFIKV
ncbi:MAG: heparan-alpha-glucosaminide N-acetyltransferase domain-containing protein [Bacteroidales bacterium]|nr:heparan-alpha-glucosaminide N-acetyltransferase domain-containing protein [Bacteroidales bacterium]